VKGNDFDKVFFFHDSENPFGGILPEVEDASQPSVNYGKQDYPSRAFDLF